MERARRTISIFYPNDEHPCRHLSAQRPFSRAISSPPPPWRVTLYAQPTLYSLDLSSHRFCLAPAVFLARHRHPDRDGQGHAAPLLVENDPCARRTGRRTPSTDHRRLLSLAGPQFRI